MANTNATPGWRWHLRCWLFGVGLVVEFEGELDLPAGGRRLEEAEGPRPGVAAVRTGLHRAVAGGAAGGIGSVPDRGVGDVDELGHELQVEPFGDGDLFGEVDVAGLEAGTTERAGLAVAKGAGSGSGNRGGIEELQADAGAHAF